ncbi:MAG: hypothetical protein MI919_43310, partial [Holophagales bacterium]|nr:hypothetical protein [Holophagales bacterium]
MIADSERLGTTANAPHVRINEFTGKTQIVGLTFGPPGLAITPVCKAPNRRWAEEDDSGADVLATQTPFGACWHAHFGGYIATRRATIQPGNGISPPPSEHDPVDVWHLDRERVWYVSPGGDIEAFERDAVFQDGGIPWNYSVPGCADSGQAGCADEELARDIHFLDAGFDRITRDPASLFGEGEYHLLRPDGSRVLFRPAAYFGQSGYARFYPVLLTDPFGRQTEIRYRFPLSDATRRPEIAEIEDSWNRILKFHFAVVGSGVGGGGKIPGKSVLEPREMVERVSLEAGGTSRNLMHFEYGTLDNRIVLLRMRTPEGRTLAFGYHTGLHRVPFVDRITLPEGGVVRIEHGFQDFQITEATECPPAEICNEPGDLEYFVLPRRQIRVEALTYAGAEYRFSYQQSEGRLATTVALANHCPDGVTASDCYDACLAAGPSAEECFERATVYHNISLQAPPEVDSRLGQPWERSSRYFRAGEESARSESWEYGAYPYGSSVAGPVLAAQPRLYRALRDGVWLETVFEYHDAPKAARRLLRRSVTGVAGQGTAPRLERTLQYLQRFPEGLLPRPPCSNPASCPGYDYEGTVLAPPFQLGLTTRAEEARLAGSGTGEEREVLGQIEYVYHSDPPWPVRTVKNVLARPRDAFHFPGDPLAAEEGLQRITTYYTSPGELLGMVESMTLGATTTSYLDYDYGVASEIQPPVPASPRQTRAVLPTGEIETETNYGVETS